MKESMDILESKWRLTMEKQNDHKKISKKIWVLSAGIIVLLVIVLFAGVKSGFFLSKSDKILYAAYHTIKDQPKAADDSKTDDYTVSFDGQWKKQKIQAEYASGQVQKQLRGTLDLDRFPDMEFVMTLDEKELRTQIPSLSSKVFTYNYKSGAKNGYIAKKIGSEKLAQLDAILEELYGGSGQESIGKDILKEAWKEFKKVKVDKTEKKEFEIDGKKRNCAGYQFTVSRDNAKNVLNAVETSVKKKYGDKKKISSDPAGKIFMSFYDKISAAEEMECSVYLYQNKLASVSVNYEDDENAQNIDVLFLGGDFRTQNMKIAFLTGEKTTTIQTNISGNLAAKDGTITFESDDTDSLSGRISVQKGCQISELTGEECNLMKLNGFELLEVFGEFAGFGF